MSVSMKIVWFSTFAALTTAPTHSWRTGPRKPLQYMSCSVPIGSGDAGWERGRVGDSSETCTCGRIAAASRSGRSAARSGGAANATAKVAGTKGVGGRTKTALATTWDGRGKMNAEKHRFRDLYPSDW